jgi:hypothetical protein
MHMKSAPFSYKWLFSFVYEMQTHHTAIYFSVASKIGLLMQRRKSWLSTERLGSGVVISNSVCSYPNNSRIKAGFFEHMLGNSLSFLALPNLLLCTWGNLVWTLRSPFKCYVSLLSQSNNRYVLIFSSSVLAVLISSFHLSIGTFTSTRRRVIYTIHINLLVFK